MTANTTPRKLTLAGVLTAGTAAAAVSLIPGTAQAAQNDSPTVERVAEQTTATAFTPTDTTDTTTPAKPHTADTKTADTKTTDTKTADSKTADSKTVEDTASSADVGTVGRGAHYTDDGTLVTIDRTDQPSPEPASQDDIEDWINEALDVMKKNDIPGTYDGIYSNLMRESSGDPLTINMWDTNAHENIPSKGLLQVIDPTFEQYHVDGTSENIYDPVANIAAACNYAADRYGSMDNVNSAY
ncbi:transglycosylase SLT domain-containing protein [Streptomyces sp. RFCAC02]|uniref:transglycosylase SLT domain-containing protein n=1 Tax=Streptomyces sp. RFCAC02 TaxID=2499143 RepID=UPI001020A312|nr:transglycosylase SLT domain-containing protein [Streptomyces sp. RFCAC02]